MPTPPVAKRVAHTWHRPTGPAEDPWAWLSDRDDPDTVAYLVGMLATTLPLPGGVGGVDGGMVAALIAFGVEPELALIAVLAYRGFAFWLPIAPGAVAYLAWRLMRRHELRQPAPAGSAARSS